VLGSLVVNMTYYIVFPMLATFYGGWIVAPVRSGSDLSTLVTNLLGEAQNPSGSRNLFPSWALFLAYVPFAVVALVAWLVIIRKKIGLRSERGHVESEELSVDCDVELAQDCSKPTSMLKKCLGGLACPRHHIAPVLLGTSADLFQWGVLASFSYVGALMTDPAGCAGTVGPWVARTATTTNRILIPLGSVFSTLLPCPKPVFYALSMLQFVALLLVLLATTGVQHVAWTTHAGQMVYVTCNGVVGGLEGYLLTMAFRYIGDDETVPLSLRRSSSGLLGFLNVVLVCVGQIISGYLASSGVVACRAV